MKRAGSVILIWVMMMALIPTVCAAAPLEMDLRDAADRAGEGWNWSQATKTLTLSHADLRLASGGTLLLPDDSIVKTEKDSSVTAPKKEGAVNASFYALRCEGDLTLAGTGLLTIESGSGGIFAEGTLTVEGNLAVRSERFGLAAGKDLAVKPAARLESTLVGAPDKIADAIGVFCEGTLTIDDAAVFVRMTDGVCGIKGNTVTISGDAVVQVANENGLESDLLADEGVFSVNAIAGGKGITFEGDPAVTASVTAVAGAECVMAGHGYDSSVSKGDLILNGGTLKISAACTETAAFGLGGIHIRLNGGSADVQVRGSKEKEMLSAALVAGKGGGIVFGEGMAIHAPKGGYISRDGRMILQEDGGASEQVSVSAGEGVVHKAAVPFTRELQWLIGCLLALAIVGVVAWRKGE